MFERIYLWLFRLYPAAFRNAYGEEALQLVRDRFQAERGLVARLRLCFDLLADLAVSVPREFRYAQPSLAGASAPRRLESGPAFLVIEGKAPTPVSLVLGGLVSLATFVGVGVSIGHGGSYRMLHPWGVHPERQLNGPSFAPEPAPQQPGGSGDEAVSGSGADGTDGIERIDRINGPRGTQATQAASPRDRVTSPAQAATAQTATTQAATAQAAATSGMQVAGKPGAILLDHAYRQRIITAVADNLRQHYFDPGVAARMADTLESRANSGADDAATTNPAFADLLTYQLRSVSQDMHLEVVYSPTALPDPAAHPTAEDAARYRKAMAESNCTFEPVMLLPHNIGYLKFDSFPDPAICGETITAAMSSLNHANAILFDLRENRGGQHGAGLLMANYLFNRPVLWYSPRVAESQQAWTHSPVAGSRLGDKPVYLLTSGATISAAEDFAYDLKMLKRALIVGERTRGAAHAGVFYRIDGHFGVAIPEVKSGTPYGKPDWESIGVEPDVQVKAEDALKTAQKLAWDRLRSK